MGKRNPQQTRKNSLLGLLLGGTDRSLERMIEDMVVDMVKFAIMKAKQAPVRKRRSKLVSIPMPLEKATDEELERIAALKKDMSK